MGAISCYAGNGDHAKGSWFPWFLVTITYPLTQRYTEMSILFAHHFFFFCGILSSKPSTTCISGSSGPTCRFLFFQIVWGTLCGEVVCSQLYSHYITAFFMWNSFCFTSGCSNIKDKDAYTSKKLQILLDIVSAFDMLSSPSLKRQPLRQTQAELEIRR